MNCPGDSVVENPPTNAGNSGSIPGSGKSLEKEMAPTSVFSSGKFHGQKPVVS